MSEKLEQYKNKTMCQCMNKCCNAIFDFKDRKQLGEQIKRDVCPSCRHSFTILKLRSKSDHYKIEKDYYTHFLEYGK